MTAVDMPNNFPQSRMRRKSKNPERIVKVFKFESLEMDFDERQLKRNDNV